MLNPILGHTVLWFGNADRGVEPCAALVTGPTKLERDNLLSLTIFRENSPEPFCEKGVRHVDDPVLVERPKMKTRGGWDYLSRMPPKPGSPTKEPPKKEPPKP